MVEKISKKSSLIIAQYVENYKNQIDIIEGGMKKATCVTLKLQKDPKTKVIGKKKP